MDPLRLLVRASQLVRRPPSRRQLILYAAVLAASLTLAGIEWFWGWPDWLTVQKLR
jgi:hypothetical protein